DVSKDPSNGYNDWAAAAMQAYYKSGGQAAHAGGYYGAPMGGHPHPYMWGPQPMMAAHYGGVPPGPYGYAAMYAAPHPGMQGAAAGAVAPSPYGYPPPQSADGSEVPAAAAMMGMTPMGPMAMPAAQGYPGMQMDYSHDAMAAAAAAAAAASAAGGAAAAGSAPPAAAAAPAAPAAQAAPSKRKRSSQQSHGQDGALATTGGTSLAHSHAQAAPGSGQALALASGSAGEYTSMPSSPSEGPSASAAAAGGGGHAAAGGARGGVGGGMSYNPMGASAADMWTGAAAPAAVVPPSSLGQGVGGKLGARAVGARAGGDAGDVGGSLMYQVPFRGDEREVKRQRRKQSNRESARRSRLRKQAECDELIARQTAVQMENMGLSTELAKVREQYASLCAQNAQLRTM
ncbi:unnamed protein product, partial [Closterium sp. NIES-54]